MSGKRLLLALLTLGLSKLGFSAEFRVQLKPSPSAQNIPTLQWNEDQDTQEPPVQIRTFTNLDQRPYFVILHGKYTETGDLLYKDRRLPKNSDGSFDLEVDIENEITEFSLVSIGSDGAVAIETDQLLFPEWETFKKNPSPEKKLSFLAGLALGGLSYTQYDGSATPVSRFSQFEFKLLGSGRYQFKKLFSLSTGFSLSALPLSVDGTSTTLRELNLDVQGSYPFPFIHTPWKLELVLGYFYRLGFSSRSEVGYGNVQGITVFPRIERSLAGERKLALQFRFTPISAGGISFLNLSSFEFNTQLAYQGIRLKNKNWLILSLDVSTLNVSLSYAALLATSASAGVQYLF